MAELSTFEDVNSADMRRIANELLGVLGVDCDLCPIDSDTKHMLWHATKAALRQDGVLREIKRLLKGNNYG